MKNKNNINYLWFLVSIPISIIVIITFPIILLFYVVYRFIFPPKLMDERTIKKPTKNKKKNTNIEPVILHKDHEFKLMKAEELIKIRYQDEINRRKTTNAFDEIKPNPVIVITNSSPKVHVVHKKNCRIDIDGKCTCNAKIRLTRE